MQRGEPVTQELARVKQVVQVGPRKLLTGETAAARIDRPLVGAKLGRHNPEPAAPDQDRSRSRQPGRQNGIKKIDPALDHGQKIGRIANPHGIARAVVWQQIAQPIQNLDRLVFGIPDRLAANRQAGQVQREDLLGAPTPKIAEAPALHDPEKRLSGLTRGLVLVPALPAAPGPAVGSGGRRPRVTLVGILRRTFIERHDHVAAQLGLEIDHRFWRQPPGRSIQVRSEGGALVVDPHQRLSRGPLAETPDLKPARVGQDRPRPAHELVQSTQSLDHIGAGAQRQMIGIGQNHLRAHPGQLGRIERLDRGLRPNRQKRRGPNRAVGRVESPGPGAAGAVARQNGELKRLAWLRDHVSCTSRVLIVEP